MSFRHVFWNNGDAGPEPHLQSTRTKVFTYTHTVSEPHYNHKMSDSLPHYNHKVSDSLMVSLLLANTEVTQEKMQIRERCTTQHMWGRSDRV